MSGDVVDWVESPNKNRELVHYNSASMSTPVSGGPPVHYGSLGPVVVAQTLRAHKMTTEDVRAELEGQGATLSDEEVRAMLHCKVRRLWDGSLADGLVFLHSDLDRFGARRSFAQLKRNFELWDMEEVITRLQPDGRTPYSALWDEGWLGLPNLCWASAANPEQFLAPDEDGRHMQAPSDPFMQFGSFEILLHELGHLLLGLGDLYGKDHGPFLGLDLLAGVIQQCLWPTDGHLQPRAGWVSGHRACESPEPGHHLAAL